MILASCPNPRSLQRQWQHERNIRQRVLEQSGWRRSIGLALLMDCKPEEYCHHGLRVLMHNQYARWLVLRDLLPGQHHPDWLISMASVAASRLRYGVPVIDFSGAGQNQNWNFGRKPRATHSADGCDSTERGIPLTGEVMDCNRWTREFAALTRLSVAMNHLQADCRRNNHGQDYPSSMSAAVPYPLLAFRRRDLQRLYRQSTYRHDCPSYSDGPRRNCQHQTNSSHPARHFCQAFRQHFCNAVADGLPLQATEPICYLGPVTSRRLPADAIGLPVTSHMLRSELDGQNQIIHLPGDARIHATIGQHIDPFDIWCYALAGSPSRQWQAGNLYERWSNLGSVCIPPAMIRFLKRIWFENQAITIPEMPDQILIPCELVSYACRNIQPLALWWDLTDSLEHFDAELEAILLPPLHRNHPDELRLELNGDLLLNAGVPLIRGNYRPVFTSAN
jgi:hypothetical protein